MYKSGKLKVNDWWNNKLGNTTTFNKAPPEALYIQLAIHSQLLRRTKIDQTRPLISAQIYEMLEKR